MDFYLFVEDLLIGELPNLGPICKTFFFFFFSNIFGLEKNCISNRESGLSQKLIDGARPGKIR